MMAWFVFSSLCSCDAAARIAKPLIDGELSQYLQGLVAKDVTGLHLDLKDE